MDFQNRVGSKTGGGGPAGWSESNRDRKERLKKLALETIDLTKVYKNFIVDTRHLVQRFMLKIYTAGGGVAA